MPNLKFNIRDRLEDNVLDLSMSDLDEVPVRDIAQVKKGTILDLSNNRLTSLGKKFSTLTHIVKLDLSKNFLTGLPDNFGDLIQLKHLDLYSNQICRLPLSLSQLKNLRWLDLKNNPLVPVLAEVVGPCLDSQQCQHSARQVVAFLQKMQEQVEEERLRRQQQRKRQQELLEQAALEKKKAEQQHQKKKKKAAKSNEKSSKAENGIKPPAHAPTGDSGGQKKDKTQAGGKLKKNLGKHVSGGILDLAVKFLLYTFLLTLLVLFLLFMFHKDYCIYVQEAVLQVSSSAMAILPEPIVKRGQEMLDAVKPTAMVVAYHIESLSHGVHQRAESFYIWLRTDENVQHYLDGFKSVWNVLCVKAEEAYRTMSQQILVCAEILKKKIF